MARTCARGCMRQRKICTTVWCNHCPLHGASSTLATKTMVSLKTPPIHRVEASFVDTARLAVHESARHSGLMGMMSCLYVIRAVSKKSTSSHTAISSTKTCKELGLGPNRWCACWSLISDCCSSTHPAIFEIRR